ncbi:MAG: hybrid sensor histidine kinase/response regulator [Alphaproteobacteria bacterium]|nr:hybrid sensor histidine kinase/response regulator [Alphaproteobacteria bacterium]
MSPNSARILVVDDIEENREILQRRLVRRGYEVVVADSGLTALAALARSSFDLVLLDIMMPDMDGLETLERLRLIADRGMLPVIMVSAKYESGDIVQALEMGASDYISKPIDFPVALARIETHLALKRADDALRNSEVRSLFLAKMSHELRTPLNAIIGFSDMIAGEMLGPIENDGYPKYAGLIKESGEHLLVMVSDILDHTQIESSGGIELNETTLDAAALVKSCVMIVRERNDAANVQIVVDMVENSLPLIQADEARIRQIVLNLLTNAVKYTSEEGTVSVRLSYDEDTGFELQIADTGIGIADIPSALASFEQGVVAKDRAYEGIGLGLPFSKSLVERHGGTLQLQSEVGVGTTVTVCLPSERAVAAAESGARLATAQN